MTHPWGRVAKELQLSAHANFIEARGEGTQNHLLQESKKERPQQLWALMLRQMRDKLRQIAECMLRNPRA